MNCGVCGEPITFLLGDAPELQQELGTDLSEYIKPSEHDSNTEYVCRQCCIERPDDVLRFLTDEPGQEIGTLKYGYFEWEHGLPPMPAPPDAEV